MSNSTTFITAQCNDTADDFNLPQRQLAEEQEIDIIEHNAIESSQQPETYPNYSPSAQFTALDYHLLTSIRRTERVYDCIDDVVQLLRNGANPNVFDPSDGNSALMYASYGDRPDVVAALLLHNVEIFHINYLGQNAFMWSSISGSIPTLNLLLQYINHNQWTIINTSRLPKLAPLLTAQSSPHHSTPPPPTPPSHTHPLISPHQIAQDLFAFRCNAGLTCIHYATRFRRKATVLYLYYKGSLLDYIDLTGKTALHHAAQLNIQHITTWFLLNSGIDLTVQDNDGNTPVHLALKENHHKFVEQLLKHYHASKTLGIPNNLNETPYTLILQSKNSKLINLQEDKMSSGVDCYPLYTNKFNSILLWLFCQFGLTYNLIIRYLRTYTGIKLTKYTQLGTESTSFTDHRQSPPITTNSFKYSSHRLNPNDSPENSEELSLQQEDIDHDIDLDEIDNDQLLTFNSLTARQSSSSFDPISNPLPSHQNAQTTQSEQPACPINPIASKSRPPRESTFQYISAFDPSTDQEPGEFQDYIPKPRRRLPPLDYGVESLDTFTADVDPGSTTTNALDSHYPPTSPPNISSRVYLSMLRPINIAAELSQEEKIELWTQTVAPSLKSSTTTNSPPPPTPQSEQFDEMNEHSTVWTTIRHKLRYINSKKLPPSLLQPPTDHPATNTSQTRDEIRNDRLNDTTTTPSAPKPIFHTEFTPISASPSLLQPPSLSYMTTPFYSDPAYDAIEQSASSPPDNDDTNATNSAITHLNTQNKPLYFIREVYHDLTGAFECFSKVSKTFCFDWNDRNISSFWAGRYLFTFMLFATFHIVVYIFPLQWTLLRTIHTSTQPTTTADGSMVDIEVEKVPLMGYFWLLVRQFSALLLIASLLLSWLVCHYSDPGVIQPAPARELKDEGSHPSLPNSNQLPISLPPTLTLSSPQPPCNSSHHYCSRQPTSSSSSPVTASGTLTQPPQPQFTTIPYFHTALLNPLPIDKKVFLFQTKQKHIADLGLLQFQHSLMNHCQYAGVFSIYTPQRKYHSAIMSSVNSTTSAQDQGDVRDDLDDLSYDVEAAGAIDRGNYTYQQQRQFGPNATTSTPQSFFISPMGDRNILHPLSLTPIERIHPNQFTLPAAAAGVVTSCQLFQPSTSSSSLLDPHSQFSQHFTNTHQSLQLSTHTTDFNVYSTSPHSSPQYLSHPSPTLLHPGTGLPQSIYATTPMYYQQPHFFTPPFSPALPSPTTNLNTELIYPTQPHYSLLSPITQYGLDNYLRDPNSDINSSSLFHRHFNLMSSLPIQAYYLQQHTMSSQLYPTWLNIPLSFEPHHELYSNANVVSFLSKHASQLRSISTTNSTIFSRESSHSSDNTASSLFSLKSTLLPSEISFIHALSLAAGAIVETLSPTRKFLYALPQQLSSIASDEPFGTNNNSTSSSSTFFDTSIQSMILNELVPSLPSRNSSTSSSIQYLENQEIITSLKKYAKSLSYNHLTGSTAHTPPLSPSNNNSSNFPSTNDLLFNQHHLPSPNDAPFLCAARFNHLLANGIVTTPAYDSSNQYQLDSHVYGPHDVINNNKSSMLCLDCRVATPALSYHCKVCSRCVYHLDHHCPMLDCCIGAGNYRSFVLFTFLGTLLSWYFVVQIALWYANQYYLLELTAKRAGKPLGTETLIEYLFQNWSNVGSLVLGFHAILFGFFVSLLFFSHIFLIITNETSVSSMERSVVKFKPNVYHSRTGTVPFSSRSAKSEPHFVDFSSTAILNGIWFNFAGTWDNIKIFLIGRMNCPIEFPVFGQVLPYNVLPHRFPSRRNRAASQQYQVGLHNEDIDATNPQAEIPEDHGSTSRVYFKQDLLYLHHTALPINVKRLRSFVLKLFFFGKPKETQSGSSPQPTQ